MKKALTLFICIAAVICLAACGKGGDSSGSSPEGTGRTGKAEEPSAAAEALTAEDFVVTYGDGSDVIDYIDRIEDKKAKGMEPAGFVYYDPATDESREGVVKTLRGASLGDSKERVIELYGDGTSGDFDPDNDKCYSIAKTMDSDVDPNADIPALMSAECSTFERYTYNNEYTMSFYFDENDELSWIFFTKED